jgi:hypothetical protein
MSEDDKNEKKLYFFFPLTIRESREGWPLLTVETEENGG